MRCGRTPEVRDARRRGYRATGRVEKGRLTLLAFAPQIVTLVFQNISVTIWGAEMVGNGTSRRRRQSNQDPVLIGGTDAPQSTPLYEARCPQAPVHRGQEELMSHQSHRTVVPLEVTVVYEPTRAAHDTLRSAYAALLSPPYRRQRRRERHADTTEPQDAQKAEGRVS